MTLLQLRYFLAVCQHKNITKAAEALHVSQPAVSGAVKELEQKFGAVLFHRLSKGISMTQEGEHLYSMAAELVRHVDHVEQTMQELSSQTSTIRLGVPPMIGTYLFPPLYKAFAGAFPQIRVETLEEGASRILEALERGMLDVAILPDVDLKANDLSGMTVSTTETVFCVCAGHPLAGRETVSIPDIEDEPLVMFHHGYYQSALIEEWFARFDLAPNIIHFSSQFNTIREFIRSGIASGFMFRSIAEKTAGLQGIPLEDSIQITIRLVWKKSRYMTGATSSFIDFTRAFVRDNEL